MMDIWEPCSFWDELVLWLRMDEKSGETAFDHSAYTNHGTAYGAIPTGLGWNFDGNDYIDCGNDGNLSVGTHDFTIGAWVKGQYQNGTFIGKYFPYQLRYKDHKVQVYVYANGEVKIPWQSTSTNVDDNKWHHIVWVCDRDAYSTLYVDGEADGVPRDISQYSGEDWSYNKNLVIGARDTTLVSPFIGYIAEVRIYNRALSAEEVKLSYDLNKGLFS